MSPTSAVELDEKMSNSEVLQLQRIELQVKLLHLSKENPSCQWLRAAIDMNLPPFRLEMTTSGSDGHIDGLLAPQSKERRQ